MTRFSIIASLGFLIPYVATLSPIVGIKVVTLSLFSVYGFALVVIYLACRTYAKKHKPVV